MRKNLLRCIIVSCFLLEIICVYGESLKPVLMLNFRNGSQVSYFLETFPVLFFDNHKLHVHSGNVTMDYLLKDIKKHTFEEIPLTTISKVVSNSEKIHVMGNKVFFANFPVGQRIMVYTIDGQLVSSSFIDLNGNAELSLQALPMGLYIIKYGLFTFKMMRK